MNSPVKQGQEECGGMNWLFQNSFIGLYPSTSERAFVWK
jgi:hypothetical protein